MKDLLKGALAELGSVVGAVDETGVDAACIRIVAARRVMLYGCGREGLMMRAFAMRLYHLGLSVSMQGDLTAPPLAKGNLHFAACGPGYPKRCALCRGKEIGCAGRVRAANWNAV